MSSDSPEQRLNSITKLPEEVLELICEQVAGFEDKDAVQALLNWTLTCRVFCTSGQRALYRSPCRAPLHTSLERAVSFQQTLISNPLLASYIRDLKGLGYTSLVLHHNLREVQLQPDEQPFDIAAWHDMTLNLATNSYALGLAILRIEQASTLGSLVAAHDPAKKLYFSFAHRVPEHRAVRDFLRAFKAARGSSRVWDSVAINVRGAHKVGKTTKPLPYRTPTLTLNIRQLRAKNAVTLLPRHPEHLRTIKIISHHHESSVALVPFFSQLAKAIVITSIYYTAPGTMLPGLRVEDYGVPSASSGTTFPLVLFTFFPRLKHLSLRGGVGMTLEKLAALAARAPRIRHISLRHTFWTFTSADFVSTASSLSPRETQFAAILERMPKLRYISLGKLPVEEGRTLGLAKVCEARGIRLRWEACAADQDDESDEEAEEDMEDE
ncbi:hypothetical protein JCM10213_003476 [Rhodosporidiobolus nylandii]